MPKPSYDEVVKALGDSLGLMNLQAELADALEDERTDLEDECRDTYERVADVFKRAKSQ